jgi:hypothetical protein
MQPEHLWLSVHAVLGLLWIALLTSRAEGRSGIGITGPQPITMPVLVGWPAGRLAAIAGPGGLAGEAPLALPAHQRSAGALPLVLLAFSLYLPLFLFNVAWFLVRVPEGGVLSELPGRWRPSRRS